MSLRGGKHDLNPCIIEEPPEAISPMVMFTMSYYLDQQPTKQQKED
jgi:hypothetical protein